ncbi:FAD binding domain-containing protein [Apiospora phragmitis]|uniref:FAD binding domain-containing protein n=1 Tax=Apiospora phragmitis TaxID=2905665 RepID=A0ABR1VF01_9PEZI
MGKDTNNIEYDIIVIGSGLAGICTALEALEHDETLSVLLIDDAGKHAHPEPPGVGDLDALIGKTNNAETREWLKQHRDAFVRDISPGRLSSCMAWPFRKERAATEAASEALLKHSKTAPAGLLPLLEYRPACRAVRLVLGCDDDGARKLLAEKGTKNTKTVTGVECEVLPPIYLALKRCLHLNRWISRHTTSIIDIPKMPAKRILFRARLGVVLATGDPSSEATWPASIAWKSRRGRRRRLRSCRWPARTCVALRSPTRTGRRFAAEDMEGKAFSRELGRKAGGEAFLILDARQWAAATKKPQPKQGQEEKKKKKTFPSVKWKRDQQQQQRQHRHQKAKKLDRLAHKIGVDADGLGKAVSEYNEAIRAGREDAFRKKPEHCRTALEKAPFYALDISLPRGRSPTPRRRPRVVGFIRVDEESGLVLDDDNDDDENEGGHVVIGGLYAAGTYSISGSVSGGSDGAVYPLDEKIKNDGLDDIAANVRSGRRAGRHAAAAASRKHDTLSNGEEGNGQEVEECATNNQ